MDRYKQKLQKAPWTWLEAKFCRFHGDTRNKDRVSGRNDKRSARQEDRKEIEQDADLPRNSPCECGESECPGSKR